MGITQKLILFLALWVGRIVSIKHPAPLAPQQGIKAVSASSLFQAKCYKLLYYSSTVKLKSREWEEGGGGEKRRKKTQRILGREMSEQSISATIVQSSIFFPLSLKFLVLPAATKVRSFVCIWSKLIAL